MKGEGSTANSQLPTANSRAAARYRGRFAPSPTGPLHFGSLVAAVASYLDARSRGGEWLVRIEDLDRPRAIPGAADDILFTLDAFGMMWDGVVSAQSKRLDAYHSALHRLRSLGKTYPCACSRREIADSAIAGIEGPVYPGTCRDGIASHKIARAWRVDTREACVAFEDRIQGRIEQHVERAAGDFVIYRADRIYAYQLAVVIDDAEQGITDVVRGADLLDSTPRQIYLQRLLGLTTPRYAHVPVAVDAAGQKLSKQTRACAIDAQRPLPALLRAVDFLGHPAPPELANGPVEDFWNWARTHWRIARVARVRTREVEVVPDVAAL